MLTEPGVMYGLMRTLPVSPPPGVGSRASKIGSGVSVPVQVDGRLVPPAGTLVTAGSHSALSVTLVTVPVGVTALPLESMSWNDPASVLTPVPAAVVGRTGY